MDHRVTLPAEGFSGAVARRQGRVLLRFVGRYEKLLEQFDVNGDGQITEADMRDRKGPAGAFPQIDMNGDGVFTRQEQQAVMDIARRPHIAAAVSTDGDTVLKADANWEVISASELGEDCFATPAVADGRMFVRTKSTLRCFRIMK